MDVQFWMPGYFSSINQNCKKVHLLFFSPFLYSSSSSSKQKNLNTNNLSYHELKTFRHAHMLFLQNQCPCRKNVRRCSTFITTTANVRKNNKKNENTIKNTSKIYQIVFFLRFSICIFIFSVFPFLCEKCTKKSFQSVRFEGEKKRKKRREFFLICALFFLS